MNFGGTAMAEDMFQWIPRDSNKIADDLVSDSTLATSLA